MAKIKHIRQKDAAAAGRLDLLWRLWPFAIILAAYESFHGLGGLLYGRVNYLFDPHVDVAIFGGLPTVRLQSLLWHGQVNWYDMVFSMVYLLHFILPVVMALVVWKNRRAAYWRYVGTFMVLSFGAFLTFLIFPTAPPWLAAQSHYIQPITRISADVWSQIGLHNFADFYGRVAPNSVAALPSLHAAWATLFLIFVVKLYGRRWGFLTALYPALIYFGTVYQGEHYAVDEIAGIAYALVAYQLTPAIMRFAADLRVRLKLKFRQVSNIDSA